MRALAILLAACARQAAPVPIVANVAPAPVVACAAPCMPDVTLVDTAGRTQRVAGRVAVVNFWATWAHPSQREIPVLAHAHAAYGERVAIIGVLVDNPADSDLTAFIADHSVPYPIIRATPAILTAYGYPDAIPTTFVYDRIGHEVAHHVGMYDAAQLAAVIDQALQSR